MKDTDWEFYYWDTNESPLQDVAFWCAVPQCRLVLPYHGMAWRPETAQDHRNFRKHGGLMAHCPKHFAQLQKLQAEQEADNES